MACTSFMCQFCVYLSFVKFFANSNKLKSDAFLHYWTTEAFLERSNVVCVLAIRCGGELELTAGKMGEHLISKGIVVQRTVTYTHEQNGKSKQYICTLEEGGQALLAGSDLLMSFGWMQFLLGSIYATVSLLPLCRMMSLHMSWSPTVRNQTCPIFRSGGAIVMWQSLMSCILKLALRDLGRFLWAMRNI